MWNWMILLSLLACSDWMDVNPKTEIESDDFFTTENGFKSALIGIYARMTNLETYGANLTFTYIEDLVQRYDNYPVSNIPTDKLRAQLYDYENDNTSKNKIATIWEHMYRNIANINNLLSYLKINGEVIRNPLYRELIEGEALALRAFHYFDLLRLWGPIYQLDSTALAVPWRDEFNSAKKEQLPANEIINKILVDLFRAEDLLKDDPFNYSANSEAPFLGMRKHKMNKFAVKALLARVYLYQGNKIKAAEYAKEVIEQSGLKLVRDNQDDVSMYEETLFALRLDNMEEKYRSYWRSGLNFTLERWITQQNGFAVFEANIGLGINDIRYKNRYGFIHTISEMMCRKYLGEGVNYGENIPLIRLVEMYYILAESVSLEESVAYINAVRNARGISRSYNIQYSEAYTEASRIEALDKEYQKEFFAEGQYFHFLKRHNRSIFYRCPVEKMIYYVLPLPNDEVEYGFISK